MRDLFACADPEGVPCLICQTRMIKEDPTLSHTIRYNIWGGQSVSRLTFCRELIGRWHTFFFIFTIQYVKKKHYLKKVLRKYRPVWEPFFF